MSAKIEVSLNWKLIGCAFVKDAVIFIVLYINFVKFYSEEIGVGGKFLYIRPRNPIMKEPKVDFVFQKIIGNIPELGKQMRDKVQIG
jgi:hypothetical protein